MLNRYAAGNNVYRGGSPVATMGKVDPAGYVNRELNNRRSQLAQTALQRMGQSAGQRQGAQSTAPVGAVNPNHVGLLAIKLLSQKGGTGY